MVLVLDMALRGIGIGVCIWMGGGFDYRDEWVRSGGVEYIPKMHKRIFKPTKLLLHVRDFFFDNFDEK